MNAVSIQPKCWHLAQAVKLLATSDVTYVAEQRAAELYGAESRVARICRGVPALGISDMPSSAIDASVAINEFWDVVRARSVVGRLQGLRRVPLRVRCIRKTRAALATWIGEGKAIPTWRMSLDSDLLTPRLLASFSVITRELAENSSPDATELVRRDLLDAATEELDLTFLGAAGTGDATRPDGIFMAEHRRESSATTDATAVKAEIGRMIDAFPGDLSRAYFVGSGKLFARLANLLDLDTLGARGGELLGIPCLESSTEALIETTPTLDSPPTDRVTGYNLALIDPGMIAIGDTGGEIDISTEGAAQMEAPGNVTQDASTGTGAQLVSFFQSGLVGIKMTRFINWSTVRPAATLLTGMLPGGNLES